MMQSSFELFPLVSVGRTLPTAFEYIPGLPEGPWGRDLRLSSANTEDQVALVVAQIVPKYDDMTFLEVLAHELESESFILPGGLVAARDRELIYPACCCGLEMWREWEQLLVDGYGPWMGHDPTPWFEAKGDGFVLWSDGWFEKEKGLKVDDQYSIEFSRSELVEALRSVENHLRSFEHRLRDWAEKYVPQHANRLVELYVISIVEARERKK